jgi:undecaprenyl pyrophosphate phosphatase UppP
MISLLIILLIILYILTVLLIVEIPIAIIGYFFQSIKQYLLRYKWIAYLLIFIAYILIIVSIANEPPPSF